MDDKLPQPEEDLTLLTSWELGLFSKEDMNVLMLSFQYLKPGARSTTDPADRIWSPAIGMKAEHVDLLIAALQKGVERLRAMPPPAKSTWAH